MKENQAEMKENYYLKSYYSYYDCVKSLSINLFLSYNYVIYVMLITLWKLLSVHLIQWYLNITLTNNTR